MVIASNITNLQFMNKSVLFLLGVLLIPLLNYAQEKVIIMGEVVHELTGNPIENVHVKVNQRNVIGRTATSGSFILKAKKVKPLTVVFSHVSFKTVYEPVDVSKDTIVLNIKLSPKVVQLIEYDHNVSGLPEAVFKSTKISIADYEFFEDKYIFLVYGKRLNKDSELYLVNEHEEIISKHFVPGEPVELYSDYMGNVNLICKNSIYRVGVNKDKISIYELPLENFNQLIKPISDTLESSLLFSDFMRQFPRFKYYAFSPEDTVVKEIKEIVHKDMDWRYNFEYHFLSNADKQFAKRMAKRFKGLDKFDIAASLTGFSSSFLYEEVYAPLFVIDDTINIFDHHEALIWKFIDDTVQVDSVPFTYHQPKRKNEWKRELIMDEVNGKIYGVFLKNGYYYLKEINNSNGAIVNEKKLHFQFVEKLKVKDGFIYYTYKPRQSLTKKFLYKEAF
jgi:hypothetical protein